MAFFAAQVWTGNEGKFLSLVRRTTGISPSVRFLWPRRNLRIRRRGAWMDSLAPLFPGYIFIQAEAIDAGLHRTLRSTAGFIRFLPSNDEVLPLDGKDQGILVHFLSFGEIVERSGVVFDENNRVRVISGPLKGLEGQITKVDRRKGRAKVKLEIYEESFLVDFGFDVLEATTAPA